MDKWGKRIGIGLLMLTLAFFAYKIIGPTEVNPSIDIGGWHIQSVLDSIFITLFGLGFSATTFLYGTRAWSKSADEYYVWLEGYFGAARLRKSLTPFFSRDFSLWKDRILAPPAFLMGVLVALYGLFSLTMNVVLSLGLAPN
jgi:predicted permease